MVAYSFQRMFVAPIRVGLGTYGDVAPAPWPKRHTIRADRRRHARPGEIVQLYCGQRTRSCYLIGTARCTRVERIRLGFIGSLSVTIAGRRLNPTEIEDFVRDDGFKSVAEFMEFWRVMHDAPASWQGVVIHWEPLGRDDAASVDRAVDGGPGRRPGRRARGRSGAPRRATTAHLHPGSGAGLGAPENHGKTGTYGPLSCLTKCPILVE